MGDAGVDKLTDIDGVVKWFDPKKGFGFIVGPEGQDIFVHYSQIEGEGFRVLKDGSNVRYSAEKGGKGWHATKVVRLDPEITVRPVHSQHRTPRR
ncbi:MAG: cold shock domain-containing protein [Phycisphaerales bacterium]|nr:cold shock domain-containing protein [Phycisphaerales bacterium]